MIVWDIVSISIILAWLFTTIWLCRHYKEKWTRLFVLAISLASIFCITPILLNSTLLFNIIDYLTSGLKYSDYKSSFLESIGGMLGTTLAIVGALWTQHHFEQEQEHKEDIENATVVYYDFKFAFSEIQEKIEASAKELDLPLEKICSDEIPNSTLHYSFSDYQILIDRNWITNVARLPGEFTSEEIEHIYYLYGLINSINISLVSVNATTADRTIEKLCEFYAVLPTTPLCEAITNIPVLVDKKKLTKDVYEKLHSIAQLRLKK